MVDGEKAAHGSLITLNHRKLNSKIRRCGMVVDILVEKEKLTTFREALHSHHNQRPSATSRLLRDFICNLTKLILMAPGILVH
jgi:hypothetical protein